MAPAAIFSTLRRSMSPSLDAFLAPVYLENDVDALLKTLTTIVSDLVSSFSGTSPTFQKKNCRSLLRKIELFALLLDSFRDSGDSWLTSPETVVLCFKELYLVLYRSKILLDYYTQSSKLWILLQNPSLSSHFHYLDQEIFTILDVLPMNELNYLIGNEVREQIELLKKQSKRNKLLINKLDESLRLKFFQFLNEFSNGRIPNFEGIHEFFITKLGTLDVGACRVEIEFLEEQIVNHETDIEPSASVLGGFIAMIRYSRYLLFGFLEDEMEIAVGTRFREGRTKD